MSRNAGSKAGCSSVQLLTLPAPAGPMTMVPNLLMAMDVQTAVQKLRNGVAELQSATW